MKSQERTGVFLVRAWWEEDRFRAKITCCQDVNSSIAPEVRVVAADPTEVQRRLAAWLGEFDQTPSDHG